MFYRSQNWYSPICGGLISGPGFTGAEGPGVVLPELVGVDDFGTGVAAFSLCVKQMSNSKKVE